MKNETVNSKVKIAEVLPAEIEKKSFQIITSELGDCVLDAENESVIKRVIHTTADFEYVENLVFSKDAVKKAIEALKCGATIVTDTNMVKSGINKGALGKLGCKVHCYMADEEIAKKAKENKTTRAVASMEKALELGDNVIFAIGNAPTALIKLYEFIMENKINPRLIIGVPVGFVNVVESKELILSTHVPHIVARGRKGGSNVAAAICNALLYKATDRQI